MSFVVEFRYVDRSSFKQFLSMNSTDQLDFLFATPKSILDYWKSLPAPNIDRSTSTEAIQAIMDDRFSKAPRPQDRTTCRLGSILTTLFSQNDLEINRTGLMDGGRKLSVEDLNVYYYEGSDLVENKLNLEIVQQTLGELFARSIERLSNYSPSVEIISHCDLNELVSEVNEVISELRLLVDQAIESDCLIIEFWQS